MLFQYYGGGLSDVFAYLEQWGIRDVILPFILIFTILFAVIERVKVFGKGERVNKYNAIVSLAIALLTVIPHVTNSYPQGFDVIEIINNSLPGTALVIVVIVMVLVVVGLMGGALGGARAGWFQTLLAIAGVLLVLGFFLSEAGVGIPILNQISPELQTLIVVLAIFGLIVYFITKPEKPKTRLGFPPASAFRKIFGRAAAEEELEEEEQ